ncbi:MAG: hypothetical protein ACK4UN_15795, partial [Limisphaerales bacterium]
PVPRNEGFRSTERILCRLGFEVKHGAAGIAQVTPQLNRGRGCLIVLPSLLISLEESTDVPASGPLYLQLEGIEEERLLSLKGKYSMKHVQGGIYGDDFYAIEVPGGGLVRAVPG